MNKFKHNIAIYLLLAADFYLLPCFISDTGSAMLLLLVLMPVVCFSLSVWYGMKNGATLFYPLAVAVLFVPSIFLFYNSSAWVYAVAYGVAALLGELAALPFRKR